MNEIEEKLKVMLAKLAAIQQYYINNPLEEADEALLKKLEEQVAELEKLYNNDK